MASCHVRLTSLRSVEESTTSCAIYGRLSGHCLKMRVKHWSRRSSPVTWTTATLRSSACQKDCNVPRLQSVQNAAARLVTGTRRSYTPVLRQLHWLPVRQSVGCDARSSVAVWHLAIVPTQRLPSCRRCSRATTTFHNCRTFVVTCIHTVPSAIEDLQLLDLDYGTIFHRTRKRQTCRKIDFRSR